MIITKVLMTSIDLLEPNEIFVAAVENILIKKLEHRYKNKCYQSIFITKINKILERSAVLMVDNRLDGGATIDVKFEVSGVVLSAGEILHGCEIIDINSNMIIAKHPFASISIGYTGKNAVYSIIQKGLKYPIVVDKVRYGINKSEISVVGVLFIPTTSENVLYNITSGINEDEAKKIAILEELIEEEEKIHVQLKKEKIYDFFKEIIYPYKKMQKYDLSPNAKGYNKLSLDEIKNIKKGVIVLPCEEHLQNKCFYHNEKLGVGDINTNLFPAAAEFLNKYYLYLLAIKGFVETYNTPEKFKELSNYWKVCKLAQS